LSTPSEKEIERVRGASDERLVALGALGLALALDLTLGEPPAQVHPVVWIGRLISSLESRAPAGAAARLAYGAGIATVVPLAAAVPAHLALRVTRRWPLLARVVVGALMLKPAFAARDLFAHVARVSRHLEVGDLPAARASLQMIVSRDTSALDEPLVVAAAVESCAENSSDSFVAPLLYFAAFGPVGALAYRATNTADAMIGYHGKYEYLGKAAARLDDLLNVIPARLTAGLIALASPLAGGSPRRALRAALRFGGATESPNAGWPMSAAAGALGIQLEKVGHYRLGEPVEPLDARQIGRAMRVVGGALALGAVATGASLLIRLPRMRTGRETNRR
jgi:adenosylcobinamide-phosphate synthase